MYSVVIPVDFTPRSRTTLDYAASLFLDVEVRFILLHAHSPLRSSEFLISIDDILEKDLRIKLELEGKKLSDKLSNTNHELIYVCEQNDILSSVANAVAKYSADLLMLGTDGEYSWDDIKYREEGKTMNLIKSVEVPSLIIPKDRLSEKPRNVVFATLADGFKEENDIKPLKELLKISGAHLDILSVGPEDASNQLLKKELKKNVNGYLEGFDFELHTLLEQDTYRAIDSFSEDHESDMVCIMYRKHGVLERLLNPSISRKVLKRSRKPILSLRYGLMRH